ncbi:BirA family transcriptional regulator, biotin operon repressor / biotin-[acetyl-CoA-carboxylase] ligase [Marinitoga hydrogenitolerans DSM 16785]|uniref:BirA family transcriptional regulator, biotin operon repressor / biotin-[acetyl-CoA-carboxylase] ligase n=2 Tax=Marinitoga TaxID=160798 RepID=A0A1M4VN29_MARH1|nr:BirA family transcriptional regulator, biotin operon repressor / biotin-[acetyl-CoA-carboxylase] ligase [Marinitoga hydrogenitolerans DSM 16785]
MKREWVSKRGGLWFSVLFKPKNRPMNPWHYVRLYTMAVKDVLLKYRLKSIIKWPNDLLVNEKKICGILGEGIYTGKTFAAIIVGVGLNVNNEIPDNLKNIATSYIEEKNKELNLKKLLKQINSIAYYKYYLKYFKNNTISIFTKKWISNLNIKNGDLIKIISQNVEKHGKIVSIHGDYLEVQFEDGIIENVYAGEVSVRKESV